MIPCINSTEDALHRENMFAKTVSQELFIINLCMFADWIIIKLNDF